MNSAVDGQQGSSELVIPLVLLAVLLVAALGFGGWAFTQMLDYKNHSDIKVAQAVVIAKQNEDKVKDAAFVEAEKQPLRTYDGPSAYGSVKIMYPKTWSAYVSDKRDSSPYVDGYFYPGVVPDTQSLSSVFALRIEVVQNDYSGELAQYAGFIKQGSAKLSPYKSPKVPGVIGSRVDGKISGTKNGSVILLPLRNMTLKIWTEAPQFQKDFDENILPNFSFLP